MYGLSTGQWLTLSPMEIVRCSFKYFEQCMLTILKLQGLEWKQHAHRISFLFFFGNHLAEEERADWFYLSVCFL